jgi:CrcB protein
VVDPDLPSASERARREITPAALGLVATGGAVGTMLRYLTTLAIPSSAFPLATFAINIAGAFVLGLLFELLGRLDERRPDVALRLRLGLGTGVLGGFTTYSSLATDTAFSVATGSTAVAALYAAGTLLLGLLAAAAGMAAGRRRGA